MDGWRDQSMSASSSTSPMAHMAFTRFLQSLREGSKARAGGGFWHRGKERESGKIVSKIDSIVSIALWGLIGKYIV